MVADYGTQLLSILQQNRLADEERAREEEKQRRAEEFNLPGTLGGLLTGAIMSGLIPPDIGKTTTALTSTPKYGLGSAGLSSSMVPSGMAATSSAPIGIDWGKLLSGPALMGGLSGALTQKSMAGNTLRDLLAGGVAGYGQAVEMAKLARETEKATREEVFAKQKEPLELEKLGAETKELLAKAQKQEKGKVEVGIKSFTKPTMYAGKDMQWIPTGRYPDGSLRWESRSTKAGGLTINYGALLNEPNEE